MKLKKLIKHVWFCIDYKLYSVKDDDREVILYEGTKMDMPEKYKNWYLDTDDNGEAISIEHHFNEHGVTIYTLIVGIKEHKK